LFAKAAWTLLASVAFHRRRHAEVETFSRFLFEDYGPDQLSFYLTARAVLRIDVTEAPETQLSAANVVLPRRIPFDVVLAAAGYLFAELPATVKNRIESGLKALATAPAVPSPPLTAPPQAVAASEPASHHLQLAAKDLSLRPRAPSPRRSSPARLSPRREQRQDHVATPAPDTTGIAETALFARTVFSPLPSEFLAATSSATVRIEPPPNLAVDATAVLHVFVTEFSQQRAQYRRKIRDLFLSAASTTFAGPRLTYDGFVGLMGATVPHWSATRVSDVFTDAALSDPASGLTEAEFTSALAASSFFADAEDLSTEAGANTSHLNETDTEIALGIIADHANALAQSSETRLSQLGSGVAQSFYETLDAVAVAVHNADVPSALTSLRQAMRLVLDRQDILEASRGSVQVDSVASELSMLSGIVKTRFQQFE
jgi:hypothetical protein